MIPRSAQAIVFPKIIKISIRFWHVYLAVLVVAEQIYGAISAQLVNKLKLGIKTDAAIINFWTQNHVANMTIQTSSRQTEIVVSVEEVK